VRQAKANNNVIIGLQTASPSVYFLGFCRFMQGLGYSTNQVQQLLLLTELTPMRYRGTFISVAESAAGLGTFCTVLLSWGAAVYALDWRAVCVLNSLPALGVGIVFVFLVPLSPHYLASRRMNAEAIEALRTIAEQNHQPPEMIDRIMNLKLSTETNVDAYAASSGFSLLFSPLLRTMTILLIVVWAFGNASIRLLMWIPLYLKEHPEFNVVRPHDAADDIVVHAYGSALLMAVGDTFGPIIAIFVIPAVDRRRLMTVCLAAITVLVLLMGIFKSAWGTVCIMPLLTAGNKITLITASLYTPEVYPTTVRSTAIGLMTSSNWAMVFIGLWVAASIIHWPFLAFAAFYAMQTTAATIASIFLPWDTKNKPLAEHFYSAALKQRLEFPGHAEFVKTPRDPRPNRTKSDTHLQ